MSDIKSKKANKDTQDYRYAVGLAQSGYTHYAQYEAIAAALLAMARCSHENMQQSEDYYEPLENPGQFARYGRMWCLDCGFDTAFAWKYKTPWLLNEHLLKEMVRRGKTQLEQMQEFKALIAKSQETFDAERFFEEKERNKEKKQ